MTEPTEALFPVDDLRPIPVGIGYRGPAAAIAAGITYRQLDYWARTELVEPSLAAAHGSGTARLYAFRDVLMLRVVKQLITAGVSLPSIRAIIKHAATLPDADLAVGTILADGTNVWSVAETDQMIDVLTGAPGIVAITVASTWQQLQDDLLHTTAETLTGEPWAQNAAVDELAARRLRKTG